MFHKGEGAAPVSSMSASVLAFMGDAVYGIMVRERLCEVNRPSGELHSLSVRFVAASAQAEAYSVIEDMLTEKEQSVFKRGRNFKTSNTPRSSTARDYHTATGLEALFGFLYLNDECDRAAELFDRIWKAQAPSVFGQE